MKTFISLVHILFLFSATCLCRGQMGEPNIPHITVLGTAMIETQPDILSWTVLVSHKAGEAEPTALKQDSILSETLKLLRDLGIKGSDIQTSRLQLRENLEYRNSSSVKDGYRANTYLTFRSSDFNAYKKLWFGLSKIQGVSVQSSSWDTSKRITLLENARRDALMMAKSKAASMAELMGVALLEPISITEIQDPVVNSQFYNRVEEAPGAGAGESSLAPGTISIAARVCVSFRIGKK